MTKNMFLLHCARDAWRTIYRRASSQYTRITLLSPMNYSFPCSGTLCTRPHSNHIGRPDNFTRYTQHCIAFQHTIPHRAFANGNGNNHKDSDGAGRGARLSHDTKRDAEHDERLTMESDFETISDFSANSRHSSGIENELNVDSHTESENYHPGTVTPSEIDTALLKYDYEEFNDDIVLEDENVVEERVLPISLDRGVTGVLEVDELVALLRDESARDICVIRVMPEIGYVDHMVLVSGRSTRHLRAMAELVQWVFKRKRGPQDPKTCRIEGLQSKVWFAMDMGNIALHLFLPEIRLEYDLETLWTVGAGFDEKSVADAKDPYAGLFSEQQWLQGTSQDTNGVPRDTNEDAMPSKTDDGMESVVGWHNASERSP